jgi:hypothetical protein
MPSVTASVTDFERARSEEIQKSNTSTSQSLLQAQQDAIFAGSLRRAGAHHIPKAGERLNSMLGVIVVPGDIIMTQESE